MIHEVTMVEMRKTRRGTKVLNAVKNGEFAVVTDQDEPAMTLTPLTVEELDVLRDRARGPVISIKEMILESAVRKLERMSLAK